MNAFVVAGIGVGLLVGHLCAADPLADNQHDAPPPPLIPRRMLFAYPEKTVIKLSPDGTRVSYHALLNGHLHLWTAPVSEVEKATTVFAPETRAEILDHHWAYTGEHLVYLSRFYGKPRFFCVELSTRKVRSLSAPELTSVEIVKLSPNQPEEVLLNCRSAKGATLVRVNIVTGEERVVLENHGYDRVFADGQFRPRVAVRKSPDHVTDLLRLAEDGAPHVFAHAAESDAERVMPLAVDGAGESFYFLDQRGRDKAALKAIDLATGAETLLAEDDLADLQPLLALHPATGKAQAATAYYGAMRRHFIDRSLEADFEFLRSQRPGEIGIAGRSLDDNTLAVSSRCRVGGPIVSSLITLGFSSTPNGGYLDGFHVRAHLTAAPLRPRPRALACRRHALVLRDRFG